MSQKLDYTSVARAAYAGDIATLRDLLRRPVSDRESRQMLGKALSIPARKNQVALMELLVEAGADVDWQTNPDWPGTALVEAVRNRSHDALLFLLQKGARVNAVKNGRLWSLALAGAARIGDLESVRLLVEHGAALGGNFPDMTPLQFAIMYKRPDVEEYLRSVGAPS
jgi:ankyrin repeat protein